MRDKKMPILKQIALSAIFLALITLAIFDTASAAGFNQFIGFGDSNLDTGYLRYHTTGKTAIDQSISAAIADGAKGGFAGNGVMCSTLLAERFGLSAAPIGGGGSNYAIGASFAAIDNPVLISAVQQIRNYLSTVNGAANPKALYVIKSGDNDLSYVSKQDAAWNAANPDYLSQQASALASEIKVLQSAGARIIIVPNSMYYAIPDAEDPNSAETYARSVEYGANLWSDLSTKKVTFIPADIDSLVKYIVQNPKVFGFTDASVLPANSPSPVSALVAILSPSQHQDFLLIDGQHFTTAGQKIVADYEYNLLTAPSQISLITEGGVQCGLARTATIQNQIDLSWQHRGPNGINIWTSAGANYLKIKNAPGFTTDSGTHLSISAGMDYQTTNGLILGTAITVGDQRQDFSTGGHFDQTDEAVSLYAALRAGSVWGNALATYGQFQDKISRQAQLGIFSDENNSDPSGRSQTFALRIGKDMKFGPVTTGPVAGVVMQKIKLDGFTENGTTGITALSFNEITRDSLVSQIGWRVSMDLDSWQPFAEAKWNHECSQKDHTVTASLSTVVAPAYSMDTVPVASDWVTTSIGTSYKLNSRVMLQGSVSALAFASEVISYGGELCLNVSF
jgi:outer membrane lipase/esterase